MDTDVDDWLGHVRVLVDTQPSVQGVHIDARKNFCGGYNECMYIHTLDLHGNENS